MWNKMFVCDSESDEIKVAEEGLRKIHGSEVIVVNSPEEFMDLQRLEHRVTALIIASTAGIDRFELNKYLKRIYTNNSPVVVIGTRSISLINYLAAYANNMGVYEVSFREMESNLSMYQMHLHYLDITENGGEW